MRDFFKKSITLAAAAALTVGAAMADAPKYIFYFIGDGMGIPEVTNAMLFKRQILKSEEPLRMTTFPVASMATTYSANSDVTDSAAAGTALATGYKTRNSMLGMAADTTDVTSIARALFDDGYGVGLVTSVAIDDATPGAFYTHVDNRGKFYEIGRTLAESGYQFAAGAALRGTRDNQGQDNGLLDYFAENNVRILYGLDGAEEAKEERLLVLSPFHEENSNDIGYTVDSIPGALTLPALTDACLAHLMKTSPDRFFMMVEGGNIDHAGHGNDGGTSVREVINFDDALEIAYRFYLDHKDETLIVVTADHETGGMSVGCAATGYSTALSNASAQKVSKEAFNNYCKGVLKSKMVYTWQDMQDYLRDNLGFGTTVKLNPDEEESLKAMFDKVFEQRAQGEDKKTLYATFNGFANRVFEILNYKSGFGWTTGAHTGAPVPVFAIGAGASQFASFNDNTDIPRKIMSAVREK